MTGSRFAQILAIVALGWFPLVLLSILPGDGLDPLLLRAEPHARLLGALVVLLLAEPALNRRIGMATRRVAHDGILQPSRREAWKASLHRLRRWRDVRMFDVALLLVIYGALALAYFGLLPDRALRWLLATVHGMQWSDATPAWWWYVLVAEPLLLLLFGRWLYRWALWAGLVWRLARSNPDVRAVHGDHVGGLGFLKLPLEALPAFVLAVSIAIAAVWFDEVAAGHAELSTFAGDLLGLLAVYIALMVLPYLVLTPKLVHARECGTVEYGELAHRYAVEFEQRWIERGKQQRSDLLGHPDVSALADMRAIAEGIERMRIVIPSADELKAVLVAGLLPFLVVTLTQGPTAVQLLRSAVVRFMGA